MKKDKKRKEKKEKKVAYKGEKKEKKVAVVSLRIKQITMENYAQRNLRLDNT